MLKFNLFLLHEKIGNLAAGRVDGVNIHQFDGDAIHVYPYPDQDQS